MECKNCGFTISDNSNFCSNCGERIDETNYFNEDSSIKNNKKYFETITILGYIGYNLIFIIPFVGPFIILIMAIITKNVNVKNYTISLLIMRLVIVILIILMLMVWAQNFV